MSGQKGEVCLYHKVGFCKMNNECPRFQTTSSLQILCFGNCIGHWQWNDWHNLPNLIFSDIMMMVGLQSLDELQKCKQVCGGWSVMTSQMTKHEKNIIMRKFQNPAAQIRKKLSGFYSVKLPEIALAASLAHHGMFGSMKYMKLSNVDLTSVPAEHLGALASCATGGVKINEVISDLSPILDNIKCKWLRVNYRRSLGSEETQAQVRAMESRVQWVTLNGHFIKL